MSILVNRISFYSIGLVVELVSNKHATGSQSQSLNKQPLPDALTNWTNSLLDTKDNYFMLISYGIELHTITILTAFCEKLKH